MAKEAKARILINDILQRSGWRFFDTANGPANIALEAKVKIKKTALDDLGEDFEKTTNGLSPQPTIRNPQMPLLEDIS